MFCENCGVPLSNDKKFCANCGNFNSNYVENTSNPVDNQSYQPVNPVNNTEKKYNTNNTIKFTPFIIGGIIIFIILIFFMVIGNTFINYSNENTYVQNNNSSTNENKYTEDNSNISSNPNGYTQNNNNTLTEENKPASILGNYSREVFSGNSFDYVTSDSSAVFTFNKDSTFEVKYSGGNTYKGTYKVYNGFYITVQASEIKEDTTIKNNISLANDINNVANKMMDSNLLNTYLLWLETENNTLQPFMISYNPETNSGVAVNIYARVQGTFNKK